MALLLHIDTATSYGAVAISVNEKIISFVENNDQKEHASFLHPAIAYVEKQSNIELKNLDAVAVMIGPGSYTGLRVGLAAAKGLCYALNKPLIAVNTLQTMALAASRDEVKMQCDKPVLYAPMIDARRMEVFTALYSSANEQYSVPKAVVLDDEIFASEREDHCIIFSGDGSLKLSKLPMFSDQYIISEAQYRIEDMAIIAFKHFSNGIFEDIAYCEPLYIKPFYMLNNIKG